MKTLLFAAALTISSVAVAQSTTDSSQTTPQPSGETVDDPSQSTGPRGVTQQGTVPDGQSRASSGDYPPCSRTVTDSCVQTYERGVRGSRPRR
jgi:hypothetical protein